MLPDGILHSIKPGRPVSRCTLVLLLFSLSVYSEPARGGDLLVASFSNNRIARFAESNGAYLGDFVPAGGGGLTTPHALGFGPKGHLYVATFGGSSVLRYNGTTGTPLRSSTGAAGTAEFVASGAGGLAFAAGMDFGPDGDLYVSDHFASRVLRYDGATGAFIGIFVASGSGGLDDAELIKFGPDEHLYVCSANDGSVMRYNGSTGALLPGPLGGLGTAEFVTPGSGGLSNPHDLAFGPDGNLYVASFGSSSVIQYDGTTGAFMSQFVAAGVPSAHGVGFGGDDNLYVASFGSTGIAHFDGSNGSPLGNFVDPGVGGLSGPADAIFCPLVSGDINGDGRADSGDVEPFVDALLGLPQLPIHLSRSDLNNSGAADGGDIMFFIGALLCR